MTAGEQVPGPRLIWRWPTFAVLAAIFIAALQIHAAFPGAGQFYSGADEGVYYRQAGQVLAHGPAGYQLIAREYIDNPGLHIFPPPLRVLPVAVNAAALAVADSYTSLAWVSLLCFVLLCGILYRYALRIWGAEAAAAATLLVCFSPLGAAMARRALIDSITCLSVAFAILAFLALLQQATTRNLTVFSISLAVLQLTRETGCLLWPFFFAAFLFYLRDPDGRLPLRKAMACFLPPALLVIVFYFSLYGVDLLGGVIRVIFVENLGKPSAYVLNYSSGPWYRYLVDFLALSPLTLLLALFFAGGWLAGRERRVENDFLVYFSCYVLFVYAFLQMNVRYVIFLDLPIRIMAVLFMVPLVARYRLRVRRLLLAGAVLLLVCLDVRSFQKLFVTNNIYDPVSANLLAVERIIPAPASGR